MAIGSHITTFGGLPVRNFRPGRRPAEVAWRVVVEDEAPEARFAEELDRLLDTVGGGTIEALILGGWGEPYERAAPLHLLVAARDRLPRLRALFVGEMTSEECEISWINHGDISPLLAAFPRLEILRIRGSDGLAMSPVRHRRLRELAVETGGLPAQFIRGFADSSFPALETLELWLGGQMYGGDVTVADLAPILDGTELPALRRLALRNAEIADELAGALAGAPVVARLGELDLSLGALSDAGAEALLLGQPLTHLRALDLAHHFISADLAARLREELPGVRVDVSDGQQTDQGDRYVSVTQ